MAERADADTHGNDPAQVLRMRMALRAQEEENAKLKRLLEERELELERRGSKRAQEQVRASRPTDEDSSATDSATVRWFHHLWFRRRPVMHSTFLGVPAWQNPLDAWVTQEIISEVRPDLIIEAGTFRGASAALLGVLARDG